MKKEERTVDMVKDTILDGRWKYTHREKTRYVFENIYNGQVVVLSYRQVHKILLGEDTIAHIICRRIGNDHRKDSPNWWTNNIVRNHKKQILKRNS